MGSGLYFNNRVSSQNEVLKKTYFLLALSLIPTILGTIVGMEFGLMKSIIGALTPIGYMIAYMVLTFALFYAIDKAGDSPTGVTLLMLFTFITGVTLSTLIQRTLNINNGGYLIAVAFGGTAAIFAGMSVISQFIKRDLGFMGKFLFIGLIALLCASLLFIIFPGKVFYVILTVAVLILFSAYLLYDLNQIMVGGETSYVRATLNVYIDLVSIFRSLLSLLGIFNSDD